MDRGELKEDPAGRGGQGDEVLDIGVRPAEIAFADVAYGARYGTVGVFPYLLGECLSLIVGRLFHNPLRQPVQGGKGI